MMLTMFLKPMMNNCNGCVVDDHGGEDCYSDAGYACHRCLLLMKGADGSGDGSAVSMYLFTESIRSGMVCSVNCLVCKWFHAWSNDVNAQPAITTLECCA